LLAKYNQNPEGQKFGFLNVQSSQSNSNKEESEEKILSKIDIPSSLHNL
jgi:hypothetical protein